MKYLLLILLLGCADPIDRGEADTESEQDTEPEYVNTLKLIYDGACGAYGFQAIHEHIELVAERDECYDVAEETVLQLSRAGVCPLDNRLGVCEEYAEEFWEFKMPEDMRHFYGTECPWIVQRNYGCD